MKIIKAKTAGFCFGVDRAVKLTYGMLEQGGFGERRTEQEGDAS